jgi:hypothetical protein
LIKNQQNTINSSEKIIGLMRDVIENGKSDEALSQIQKQEIKQYICLLLFLLKNPAPP